MFDQAYCVGMTLGTPQISLEGLAELAAVLTLLGETQSPATRSRLSKVKEGIRAKKSISQSGAICPRTEAPDAATSSDHRDPEGLLGALADLLLAAAGVEGAMTKEDGHERQDHA